MADAGPLVSVIIAVKDGEKYVRRALADVAAQTYGHHEILVIDGGSRDRSAAIAAAFPGARCIDQRGDGLADAWNTGIESARGDLIAFLDSDDRWMPQKLELQVAQLASDPGIDYSIAYVRFFLEAGQALPAAFRPELLEGDHLAQMPSALLARRSVFEDVGTFSTGYDVAVDIDWFARAKDAGITYAAIPEVMVLKRVHAGNLSLRADRPLNAELLRLLRDSVARKRA